jgi:hypothetical protein
MRAHTLLEPVAYIFPYGICTTRDLSIFRSRKHPSPAVPRAPHERKARTGCRSRGVSKKSESRKRHHSLYSGGPREFKAHAGCYSRDALQESHPTSPRMWHGQKARVGSELGTKSRGNRRAVRAFGLRQELQQLQTHMHSKPARDCDGNLLRVPEYLTFSRTHEVTGYRLCPST